jgi:hypothetical protein
MHLFFREGLTIQKKNLPNYKMHECMNIVTICIDNNCFGNDDDAKRKL